MNLLLWGTQVDESLFPTLELIKSIGFDGVEVPIFNPNPEHWYAWRKKLDDLGLERVCDTFCGAENNLISPDPAIRQAGLDYLKSCVDCALVLGSDKLMGPFHSALGIFTGLLLSVELSLVFFSGSFMKESRNLSSDLADAKFKEVRIPVGCFGNVTNAIAANDV